MKNTKEKKRVWKATWALLLSTVLALSAPASYLPTGIDVYAAETQADDDAYVMFVIEGGVLMKYYGTATDVVIPKGVTRIESEAFQNSSGLKNVVIPEGVTSIGNSAFRDCSSLTSVAIPKSVTSIGVYAFRDCSSLTSITIPEGMSIIEYGAFRGCSSLKSIAIPESVTLIGPYAFCACSSLTSITIPENVTEIMEHAFRACSSLTSIVVDERNTTYDSRENCNAIIKSDSNCLIVGSSKTFIPESVTSIGSDAFWGSSLTSITIPEGVTSIGKDAFYRCRSLTSITILEGVSSIGENAFMECSSLTSIVIPASVTSIGDFAFCDCSSLKSVFIPISLTSINDFVFYDCTNLTTIYGEEGSFAQTYAQYWGISFQPLSEQEITMLETIMRLAEENKKQDTVIQTSDGLTFTFKKGTMNFADGIGIYDFGAEITKDYASLPDQTFTEDEFAFRIDYNYSGQLPGEAEITIPAGSEWAGKRLYYYEIKEDGTYGYVCRSTVAADGSYKVKQDHCSNYVATTKVPKNLGDCDGDGMPKTMDALAILQYIVGNPQRNFYPELADCDGQDGITTNDALYILKFIAEDTKFK